MKFGRRLDSFVRHPALIQATVRGWNSFQKRYNSATMRSGAVKLFVDPHCSRGSKWLGTGVWRQTGIAAQVALPPHSSHLLSGRGNRSLSWLYARPHRMVRRCGAVSSYLYCRSFFLINCSSFRKVRKKDVILKRMRRPDAQRVMDLPIIAPCMHLLFLLRGKPCKMLLDSFAMARAKSIRRC